jgi:hypothetical protein
MLKLLIALGLGVLGYRALRKWLIPNSNPMDIQKKPDRGRAFNKVDAVDADFEDLNE